MAMFTKTLEAVGSRPRALPPEDTDNSRAAPMPQPLVEARPIADGNPGRRALVVRLAVVAAADGMVADSMPLEAIAGGVGKEP